MQVRQDEKWKTLSTHWPSHWKDLVHDEDGGYDMFGRKTQDSRAVLRQELAKLAFSRCEEWAVDDVSGRSNFSAPVCLFYLPHLFLDWQFTLII